MCFSSVGTLSNSINYYDRISLLIITSDGVDTQPEILVYFIYIYSLVGTLIKSNNNTIS